MAPRPRPATITPTGEPRYAAAYRFRVRSSCGERPFGGLYVVVVRNGAVTEASQLDSPRPGPLERLDYVLSLEDMEREIAEARREGADRLQVVREPGSGRLRSVDIDPRLSAIDEESCYAISGYRALPR